MNELTCTCWDVNAGECELHRLMDMDCCDYDWTDGYEEERENDVPYYNHDDDDLPF